MFSSTLAEIHKKPKKYKQTHTWMNSARSKRPINSQPPGAAGSQSDNCSLKLTWKSIEAPIVNRNDTIQYNSSLWFFLKKKFPGNRRRKETKKKSGEGGSGREK